MSKSPKPGRQTVELRPSRIRREPPRPERQVLPRSPEREMWFGISGVMLIAGALGTLIVGIAVITAFRAVAKTDSSFRQCYNAAGGNCVFDGASIRVDGERIAIAGITAPRIQGAACPQERQRGIAAAVRLTDILNSGKLTIGAPAPDPDGRQVRTVKVDDVDVAGKMISAGLSPPLDMAPKWCS